MRESSDPVVLRHDDLANPAWTPTSCSPAVIRPPSESAGTVLIEYTVVVVSPNEAG